MSLIHDRRGRLSWLRVATLTMLIAPGLELTLQWLTGGLGGRPIREFTHGTGDWTIYFLLTSLAITPMARLLNWSALIDLRRMIGVGAACYALFHFSLYIIDQKFDLLLVASEIAKRYYLLVGFIVVIGLSVLAITSTDAWMARLGRRWRRLHKLIYPLMALGLLHYFQQSKADVTPAVFVAGIYLWEMLWRLLPRRLAPRLWPLPAIAVATALLTAAVEASWYGLATRINPVLVLQANLDTSDELRPAVLILMLGLLLSGAITLRRKLSLPRIRRAVPQANG